MLDNSTNTHSECVILIALLPQQWLQERSSVLRYTSSAGLVILNQLLRYVGYFVQ